MTWSRKADLKQQLQKMWDRGEYFLELLEGSSPFPLKLKFKAPTSKELEHKFDETRTWVSEIRALPNCRVVMRDFKHRLFGQNSLPSEVWVDTVDDALTWIGKRRDYDRFAELVELTQRRQLLILPWLRRNSFKALENAVNWERLLAVVDWMQANQRPEIYLREVVIPGVHSKFIEGNQTLLSELFDVVLPPGAVNANATGVRKFAARYGFCEEKPSIRFRILDSTMNLFPGQNAQDIALDWVTFAALKMVNIQRVFIVENKTNFLAFPEFPGSVVIFGEGYGFEFLGAASWMLQCNIYYWGDLDTHGFAALHGARKYFPHIRSLMMDEPTIVKFQHLKGTEERSHDASYLDNLSQAEQRVFDGLKSGVWGDSFRLEQEHIDWDYACDAICGAIAAEVSDTSLAREPVSISFRDIVTYLNPSLCDLRVYLSNRESPSDRPSPYSEVLRRQHAHHMEHHLKMLGAFADLSMLEEKERIAATVEFIQQHVPVIYKPVLSVSCRLAGELVEITGEADFLILEKDRYVVRSVSLVRDVSKAMGDSNLSSVHTVRLFSWLLEQSQGIRPIRLEVISGNNEVVSVPTAHADVLRLLLRICTAKRASEQPYGPVGLSKCSGCQFSTRCWTHARETNDVAMLPGVNQELARVLRRQGAPDISSLLASFDVSRLSEVSVLTAGRSARVGKSANKILAAAHAFHSESEIWIDRSVALIEPNVVVMDFEGMPPYLESPEFVFLFGMQVFGADAGAYLPSLVTNESFSQDEAWSEFLLSAQSVLDKFGDIPFIHWHHYEPTMIRKYIEKFGDRNGAAARILNNAIDLLPLLQSRVILPIPSYSLKTVEKYLGFSRSQTEYGGDWAMAKYLDALTLNDDDERAGRVAEILTYNREDLQATFAVLEWLRSRLEFDKLTGLKTSD